jgi:hypothetical protein
VKAEVKAAGLGSRRANDKVCAVGQDEVCGGEWCHGSPSAPPCGKAVVHKVKSGSEYTS